MKKIPLTQGKFALVDDEDYDFLMQWKWHLHSKNAHYASRQQYYGGGQKNRIRKNIYMHSLLMKTPETECTDHINGNGLDNRKSNLRIATHNQNAANRGKNKNRPPASFKGVCFDTKTGRWKASIGAKGRYLWLGRYDSDVEAAIAYNDAAKRLHGEFAFLNDIKDRSK